MVILFVAELPLYGSSAIAAGESPVPQPVALSPAGSDSNASRLKIPGEKIDRWHGFVRHTFTVDGCTAWIVEPKEAMPGKPWSWCMEFPDAFTEQCAAPALLEKGFHHAHISVGNTFGCPAAIKHFNAFYEMALQQGLARKATLIGISRGGLYAYRWAAENPGRVSVIYGDAPVCDFKSWPGGKGKGAGSAADWASLQANYGFRSEAEALAYPGNPVDLLAPLAKAKVALIHVVGDIDEVVPVSENTAIVEARYKQLGGTIEVIHKPAVGHHPHGLPDPAPVVDFILRHTERMDTTDNSSQANAKEQGYRDLFPDTWVATDALGRHMPPFSAVGPVKKDQRRVVGIFYITWHSDSLSQLKSPYTADVSKVLASDPKARLNASHPLWTEGMYHWGEPEMGYFLSKDEYVIRKDMSMLADAGVDVLVMDVTNAVRYWDEWDVLFPVMLKMKAEGNKVPQFCFWAFNGPVITVVQDLYDRVYKLEKYKDLWFMWDGKPLLLYNGDPSRDANGLGVKNPNPHYLAAAKTNPNHPHYGDPDYAEEFYRDYSQEVKRFFTLRTMWWGYYEWAGKRFVGTEDNWSFGLDLGDARVRAMNPDHLISLHQGQREEAAVTPAQHPSSLVGKSWTREHGEPALNEYDLPVPTYVPWLGQTVERPEGYGIYYQERWEEALRGNPQFLYINDWNEWTAGKYPPTGKPTTSFMRRESPYFFVDQYNAEFNRCLQPMKGGYTDNYYMQMAQNIRRYKGVRPIPENVGFSPVKIDGDFSEWNQVAVEYRDTVGDTFHRDYKGYGGLQYRNDSGRNDITTGKVAIDQNCVSFYVRTREAMTSHTGTNWMLLLIDSDQDAKTGWYGYDYLVNQRVVDEKTTTLMRYDSQASAGSWVEVARLDYRYAGPELEVAVPRKLLGLVGETLTFDFHWCDNPLDLEDPISLCTHGDSAPNRRFNYRCIWRK